jgi:hypothetical protein
LKKILIGHSDDGRTRCHPRKVSHQWQLPALLVLVQDYLLPALALAWLGDLDQPMLVVQVPHQLALKQ